jgi:2-keto-4-pentenoate hydratase/2-oxohepta-3-ene-1,7-dioic acid hydratase in catechol pathway
MSAESMRTVRIATPDGAVESGSYYGDGRIELGDRAVTIDEVAVLAPSSPAKIVCAGLNYSDHPAELGMEVP